ncbi:hypothetical protein DV736_g122, partial [Chaetothyriales sp. CBS 134916]
MTSPTTQQRTQGLLEPAILLYLAVKSFVLTLIDALVWRKRHLSDVRDDAFAQFWDWITPPRDPNQPLEGSAAIISQLLPSAEGIVLELGPGSGDQIQNLKPARKQITKVYGAEPCIPLHIPLRANARLSGFGEDKYEIVSASAEKHSLLAGLDQAGLLPPKAKASHGQGGVFDTIICVRVLCSVDNLEETCDTLYRLLKPGGKLLFCEHVVNPWRTAKGSGLARALQIVYSLLGWTFFVGNCHLTRNTGQVLINAPKGCTAGSWAEVQLDTHFGWSCLPYASGTLVK